MSMGGGTEDDSITISSRAAPSKTEFLKPHPLDPRPDLPRGIDDLLAESAEQRCIPFTSESAGILFSMAHRMKNER